MDLRSEDAKDRSGLGNCRCGYPPGRHGAYRLQDSEKVPRLESNHHGGSGSLTHKGALGGMVEREVEFNGPPSSHLSPLEHEGALR